jgi:hydrogenase expression/formation protein HypC
MCLALPAKVIERDGDDGRVRLGDASLRVSLVMTPDAGVGAWVLVHAGFAIQEVGEEDARETWRIYEEMQGGADG